MKPSERIIAMARGLFEARGADLHHYLRQRLRSETDARDIAQEAYLRFIRLGDPDRIDNPEAYLFRIAGNLLWEHNLKERSVAGMRPLDEVPTSDQTPVDFAISDEAGQRLRAVLDTLPVMPRAVLILHLRDGLTCAAIGAQAGISASMVKKHLHAALAVCRRRLRDLDPASGEQP